MNVIAAFGTIPMVSEAVNYPDLGSNNLGQGNAHEVLCIDLV